MQTMTKTKLKAKRTTHGNAAGRELMEGVREALRAASTGDFSTLTVREVEISDPGAYGTSEVRSLRESLGVSQTLFAQLVGVSPRLVAHWEYGIRSPAPVARRLLDRIKQDPDGYMKSLIKRRKVAAA
jgi:putative transcriptional regulator